MCRRCAWQMEREYEASRGHIRDQSSYVMDKMIVSAIFSAFLLLIILLVEGLHWVTGGKTPSFLMRDEIHGRPLAEPCKNRGQTEEAPVAQ